MGFDNFLAYSQRSHDEMPLYLFDKHFASKAPQLAADYKVLNPAQDTYLSMPAVQKPFGCLHMLPAVTCALECHACQQIPSLLECSSLGDCL